VSTAADTPPANSPRERILAAAVSHAAFDGWTDRILVQGARDAGYPAEMAEQTFPDGVEELIEAFSRRADAAMAEGLARHDLGALKVREKVALAVRLRLEYLLPHREAVRRLTAHCALPQHAALGARLVARTVDAIWRAAGDTSTDFSWYTKRGLLAAVYGATVLYWLADESEGRRETWAFLDRRLGDVMRIPRVRGALERVLGHIPSPLRAWRLARRRGSFT
jgi:ubiquinone biosynthesis protein COQ9